ncbi:MAG: glutathione S-transferase [Deltaproteobacteria bacterium]|nr:glutathione S-transferase [Deltaproteobacteria bacterium]
MTLPLLHHFRLSHYNEKARWALDFKGVRHRRRAYLPGLHMAPLLLLSGQRQVPVLRDGAATVVGSAAIVDHLERTHPDPPLYPAAPALRAAALEIQTRFDDQVGGPARAAFFFDALQDPRALAPAYTRGPGPTRALYRAIFPGVAQVMRRSLHLNAQTAAHGRRCIEEGLDLVAARGGADGYLVGDCFSIADLAAAAILSPAVLPPEFPYLPPQPYAPLIEQWVARWRDHPGAIWVRTMYRRHRGRSAALRD